MTLREPTHATQELLDAGLELRNSRLPPRHLPVRLLGFGVSHLDDSGKTQQHLFEESIAEVVVKMGLKKLPLLPSRHTFQMAKHGGGCLRSSG
jgi:hypothetical protein